MAAPKNSSTDEEGVKRESMVKGAHEDLLQEWSDARGSTASGAAHCSTNARNRSTCRYARAAFSV